MKAPPPCKVCGQHVLEWWRAFCLAALMVGGGWTIGFMTGSGIL